jgi:hypothetical protein
MLAHWNSGGRRRNTAPMASSGAGGSRGRWRCAGGTDTWTSKSSPAPSLPRQTVSASAGIGFKTIVGFVMPSVWASGALTFRTSADNDRAADHGEAAVFTWV